MDVDRMEVKGRWVGIGKVSALISCQLDRKGLGARGLRRKMLNNSIKVCIIEDKNVVVYW